MYKVLTVNIEEKDPFKFYFGLLTSIIVTTGIFLSFIQLGDIKTDGSIFASVALKDLNGGVLYIDAWENKPPGIFYLIEFFLLIVPNPIYALFIMAYTAFILTSVCLYILILNNIKSYSASILFTSIAIFFTVYKNNIGEGLCTEIYGTLCILISMVFFQISNNYLRKFFQILSALFLGTAFWFKEPFILVSGMLYIIYFLDTKGYKGKLSLTLFAILPSLIFISTLYFQGALIGYFDTIKYNFNYLNKDEPIALKVKINDFYVNLIYPIIALTLFFLYLGYKALVNIKTSRETLLQLLFLLSACSIFAISPHNFGHYYYPAFTLIFVIFSRFYGLYSEAYNNQFKWPLIVLCVFTFYKIDETQKPNWTFAIKAPVKDNFEKYLSQQKGKTLFIDYVTKGAYYLKTGLLYPTFLPLALPVHFGENPSGIENRKKIWNELSQNPPDFIITTYTGSYFSWYLPDSKFYENNFEKIDSIMPIDDNILYLWRHKKRN